VYQHCRERNILSKHQYGYRLKTWTEKVAFNLLNELYDALNKRIIVGGLFCNLKKALCCVDHGILLSKLKFYGTRGKFLCLIKTYLEDRYQKVQINVKNWINITSTQQRRVSYGVPQGSTLGPSLFLNYINDLSLILERYSFPVFFADDTSVVITDTNSTNFLSNSREIFSHLNKWYSANLLKLNYDKTNFLHFTTKNSLILDMKFEYNNKAIYIKLDTKFLWTIMDSTLQWKAHIHSLLLKLNAACYTLKTVKLIMSQQVLVMVYVSYFHLIMSYGITFGVFCPTA